MRYLAGLYFVAISVGIAAAAVPPPYTVSDLGAIPHFAPIFGNSVNSDGAVVGAATRWFTIPNGGGGSQERAYLITSAGQHEILVFNGSVSAWAINAHGQVAGTAIHYSMRRAFVWQNGTWTMLPPLPGSSWSWANSMNDQGQIVGGSYIDSNDAVSHGVLWQPDGTMIDLGTVCGEHESAALGINNLGEVVGTSDPCSDFPVAFLWRDGQMTALPRPSPRRWSIAVDINDAGLIVGYGIGDGIYEPLVWSDGSVAVLPLPADRQIGEAHAVNAAGAIVGYVTSDIYDPQGYRAMLWNNDRAIDLNILLPANSGWLLTRAADISDAGHIVGQGFLNGEPRGFLLTPTLMALPASD